MSRPLCVVAATTLLLCLWPLLGDLDSSYVVPLDDPAILYATRPTHNFIDSLQQKLDAKQAHLRFDPQFGYLPSLLEQLGIPIDSQLLVFSKTSFQAPRISPRSPRALYFTDKLSVGYVRGGDVLEIAAVDPDLGTVFYTLEQEESAKPHISRRDDCLQCHASGGTLGVPGLTVRSVFPDRSGQPFFQAGTFTTDHRSPLSTRWGGWYVTGTHGSQIHMGNAFATDMGHPEEMDRSESLNVTSLEFRLNTKAYLSSGSDIVALMMLEHQTRMTNLITRLNFETRMAMARQNAINISLGEPADQIRESTRRIIANVGEPLLKYLLFTDEALLQAPIKGTSGFTEEYAARGPKDHQGRSVREFDLTHRLLKYPCSPLIYSEAFDHLPDPARAYLYKRLREILTGQDQTPAFARLTKEDRSAIYQILLDTKRGLPDDWHSR